MSKNIPELRFPEFKGEWEEKSLVDISHFSKGKGISKNDISEEGLECIRYGELYTTYNEKISKIVSKTNLNPDDLVLSDQNDIIIPTSGETAIDLATASCVMKSEVAIGGDTTIIKTDQNGLFLTYCLNNKRNNISQLAQGVSVVHLYATHLKILKIYIPSLSEQNKIVSFLSKVDEKIEKLEEKQQQWETYKKGIMQQIFNQKLRFKDENGENYPDWEIKNLGNISKIKTGSKDLKDNVNEGKYPFFVRSNTIERINTYSFDGEAILIPGDGVNVGKIYHYINGKFDYHQRVYKISDFSDKSCGKYIYYYMMENFLKQALKNSLKASVDSLRLPTIKEMKVNLPSLPEQTKIAKFLSSIDEEIECVNKELELNKEFKKGLLQHMFC